MTDTKKVKEVEKKRLIEKKRQREEGYKDRKEEKKKRKKRVSQKLGTFLASPFHCQFTWKFRFFEMSPTYLGQPKYLLKLFNIKNGKFSFLNNRLKFINNKKFKLKKQIKKSKSQ